MWELVAEGRELLCLRVHVGAGGCVKTGVLEAQSLCGSWRLCQGSCCRELVAM